VTISTAYIYRATVVDVHDGDTFTADIDLGFNIGIRYRVRLVGCNAIELDQPGGYEARAHLLGLIPVGSVCRVSSVAFDKYGGRIDAVVRTDTADVGIRMILDGFAAKWDGTGPRPTPPWPIP
jgi:endonuclease YncB( thermonuclease family)